MNILLFLIPISLVMIGVAALVFVWAVRHGQFEDMDTPALDILRDDDPNQPTRQATKPEATADERDAG